MMMKIWLPLAEKAEEETEKAEEEEELHSWRMKLAEQSSESLGNSIRLDHTVKNQIMGNEDKRWH